MSEKKYNNRKVVELYVEASHRRHFDEIHPFVMIVRNDQPLTIQYINRPIYGLQVEDIKDKSLFQIYDAESAEKVLDVFAESKKTPVKEVDFYLELPTTQGLARFSEQCVFANDCFYVTGSFVGMY